MKDKYQPGQQVYFLVCGKYVTKASVVSASSSFVTIRFSKRVEECVIRLPYSRIFSTEAEASKHIRPDLPPIRPKCGKRTASMSVLVGGICGNKKKVARRIYNFRHAALHLTEIA